MAEILERDGYKVKIKVEVPASQVEQAYRSVLNDYASRVRVPGFRPGKAPAKVIEAKIGKELLLDEVKEALRDETFPKAARELSLLPVGARVLEEHLTFGEPFVYTVEVENYPEVKLPDWRSFKLEVETPELTDEVVNRALEDLRSRYGEMVAVDREVQANDHVFIETEDGGRFPVVMENAQPHVREALLGKKAGDEVLVPVKDGETVVREVKTKVLEVKALQLPELDDEFAKTVGEDNLEALTAKVRESLKAQFERETRNAKASQLLEKLAEALEVEIPPSMQQREERSLLQSLAEDLQQQRLDINEYLQQLERDGKLEEFKQNLSQNATKRLRRSLAVEALAEELKTALSQEEFDEFLAELARSYRTTPARLQNELDQEALARLRIQRLHDKALLEAVQILEGASA
ncbi:trigger factor [Meiothermus ruber]|uniref:Trigger factor n=1 Tax=Meiothermus ruber (strain ATCC 35948 / DSM 1279 / VKM B-1258 / 21) TaxID=504728 RepID=D3PS98_MEIRD|nr:trigger factor [Meiothermus ruber]ADD28331.1 trigger factor [Meiothermus ruber DSM 1279]AGK06229.1 trigger factor [Meiothermus ruber DSM 1279]MCL6529065.1 trigger factor [Meiothermus ruber]GAO75286.1 trigger factor [Meiothermus ruber H328]